MKAILLLTFCAPILLQAQVAHINSSPQRNPITHYVTGERSGITWINHLSWQQVLKKAKKENKYIFIDCYATWCKPCKQMDKEVYTNDSVGDLLNANFLSVKVQMDSTKEDNNFTRSWHKTAKEIGTIYRIEAYPTFLFLSPAGEVVYKDYGYKAPDKFMQVAKDALTPSKQYYALVRAYKKGKKDYANIPNLITMSKQLGDTINYHPLLKDYYAYLQSLEKNKLYTKDNITFIASTISKQSQYPFRMFYPDGKEVDNIMRKEGYAKKVVDEVIIKEKVNPFLNAVTGKAEPDWNVLYNTIAKDYQGDYADFAVMQAKMNWYYHQGNMLKFAIILNDKMEKYGSDTTIMGEDFRLNTRAFILFEKINNIAELKRITGWMAGVVRRGEKATGDHTQYWPYYMDTYANLLYKVGETPSAIKWQELALTKGRELGIDKGYIKTIEGNLDDMKKGKPTWPTDTK